MYFAFEGHLSGEGALSLIILVCGITAIFFSWLIVFAVRLISAMEEFRKTDRSDIDKLKSCKKKMIFCSIMTALPLLLLACIAYLR